MAEQQEAFDDFLERIENGTLEKNDIHRNKGIKGITVLVNDRFGELTAEDIRLLFEAIAKNKQIIGIGFMYVKFKGTTPKQIYEEVCNNINLTKIYVDSETKEGWHIKEENTRKDYKKDWQQIQEYLKLNEAIQKIREGKQPKSFEVLSYKDGKVLDLTKTDVKEEQLERLIEAIAEYDITSIRLSAAGQREFLKLFNRLDASNDTANTPRFFDEKGNLYPTVFKEIKNKVFLANALSAASAFKKELEEEKNTKKILKKKSRRPKQKSKKREHSRLESSGGRSTGSTKKQGSSKGAVKETGANMKGQNLKVLYTLDTSVKKRRDDIEANTKGNKAEPLLPKTKKHF